ncbi:MAG: polysaccharide biosynthesis protein [Lachnospiraceae bacterium]|nr:polysaccharide biosynthesis protein [Lachnospiraceae bacterium]
MADRKKNNGFIVQGSILAVAAILVRIIGLIYRIPMRNIIGDEGMGYYSYAYEPYSVMLMLSYHGIPAAVSKLVAANKALGKYRTVKKIFWSALSITITIGCITGSIMFFGAGFLSSEIIGIPMAKWAMMVLGPTLFVLSMMGVLRGFFQGLGTTIPTAISQIFEQIVNAVVSIIAALHLFNYGAMYDSVVGTESHAEAYGAAGGTMGTFLGATVALLFLFFVFKLYSRQLAKLVRKDRGGLATESMPKIMGLIAATAVPLIFNSILFNCNTTVESIVFNKLMIKDGMVKDEISTLWGVFTGQYKVLVTVPISVATALAVSIIPDFAKELVKGNIKTLRMKLNKAVRFGMLIAIPSAVGLSVLAEPILELIFPNSGAVSVNLMRFGTVAVVLYSLSTITTAALQGINRETFTVFSAGMALVTHLLVLAVCVGALDMGIYGVMVSYIAFALIVCMFNSFALMRLLKYRQEYFKTFVIPIISAVIMAFVVIGLHKLVISNVPEATMLMRSLACAIAVIGGVLVYAIALLIFRGIDENDVRSLPKGDKLVRLFKALRLLP